MRLRYAIVPVAFVTLALVVFLLSSRTRRGVSLGFAGYTDGPVGSRKLMFVVTNDSSKPIFVISELLELHRQNGWSSLSIFRDVSSAKSKGLFLQSTIQAGENLRFEVSE